MHGQTNRKIHKQMLRHRRRKPQLTCMLSPVVRHYQQTEIHNQALRQTNATNDLRAVDRQTHREIHKHIPRQTNPTTDLHNYHQWSEQCTDKHTQRYIIKTPVRQTNTTDLHITTSGQNSAQTNRGQTNIQSDTEIHNHTPRQTNTTECISSPLVIAVHRQTRTEIH